MYLDIRKCGNDLVFGGKLCALLELEVAYRTRQGKVAIDTSEVNKPSGSLNTRFLGCSVLAISFSNDSSTYPRSEVCDRRKAASPGP